MATDLETFRSWAGVLADLDGTMSLLNWDRDTTMPPSGAGTRAHQTATLATLYHRELTRPEISGVLEAIANSVAIDAQTRRQAMLLGHRRARAVRLPERLVGEISQAESESVVTWREARERGDWAAMRGPLTRLVALKRREAEAISDDGLRYDALLDGFEPDARAADLAPVFADLSERLAPLVAQGTNRPAIELPERYWPPDAQLQLAHDLAQVVGFNLADGCIGVSAHPFSNSSGHGDVRFSTRIDERNPISNIRTVLHEAGHAMYEQGFSADFARTALRDAPSLGAHEAQARFWENHVGGTLEFWRVIEPRLYELFPDAMQGLGAEDFHAAANTVRPSLIRVEADEVTYNLHIILRFELELGLIGGTMEVADLPEIWDSRMHELLGITPTSVITGVMQDVHWPEGMFGYFPTYTLGNLYAAQLAEAADTALGGLQAAIGQHRFGDIVAFMRERIHQHGSLNPTPELMMRATGHPLSADPLIAHLERRVVSSMASVARQ